MGRHAARRSVFWAFHHLPRQILGRFHVLPAFAALEADHVHLSFVFWDEPSSVPPPQPAAHIFDFIKNEKMDASSCVPNSLWGERCPEGPQRFGGMPVRPSGGSTAGLALRPPSPVRRWIERGPECSAKCPVTHLEAQGVTQFLREFHKSCRLAGLRSVANGFCIHRVCQFRQEAQWLISLLKYR
jgi:hypothetical protein